MSYRTPLLTFAFLAACSGDKDAATTDGTPAQTSVVSQSDAEILAPITEYRLTMDKIDRYFQSQRNLGRAAAALSPAERAAMEAANESSNDSNNDDSLEDMARKLDRQPLMAKAIRDAGLSTKEYATLTIAIMQAGMAQAVLEMRPNDNQDSLAREMKVNPANLVFMRQHKDEIAKKGEAIAAEWKAAGLDQ